uniref:Uncharacterized protein n=1 Tax=Arundo donax TaxID=35708 RepID=A0A0A8YQD9_ARUDO
MASKSTTHPKRIGARIPARCLLSLFFLLCFLASPPLCRRSCRCEYGDGTPN